MISIATGVRIFVFTGVTDMRRSFNGLSGMVAEHFSTDLLSGHLFLFFNRRRDSIKLLHWDSDGLVIWYKRLEQGTFQMPAVSDGQVGIEMRSEELMMLLRGIDYASVKRRKRFAIAS